MIGIAVSAPLEREDRIVREAARHGHRVVIRAATAEDLAERLAARAADAEPRVDLVVVVADGTHASRGLVEACDGLGLRIVALAADAAERARASTLGIDAVAEEAGFAAIEAAAAHALDRLRGLADRFLFGDAPFTARPHPARAPAGGEYDHLSRLAEWSGAEDAEAGS